MEIDGPIRVGVVEPSPEGNYELHISFRDEFQQLPLEQQGPVFRDYLAELYRNVQQPDLDERTRQGMLIVQQVCEQLLELIEKGDLPLSETLVVEIQRSPGINLTDLLN
jgi:hypothetical protein